MIDERKTSNFIKNMLESNKKNDKCLLIVSLFSSIICILCILSSIIYYLLLNAGAVKQNTICFAYATITLSFLSTFILVLLLLIRLKKYKRSY